MEWEQHSVRFRAWDIERKRWYQKWKIYFAPYVEGGSVVIRAEHKEWDFRSEWGAEEDEIIITEYADLFDIDGTEIAEGDIISAGGEFSSPMVVIKRHGAFGYEVMYDFVVLGRNHHYFDLTKDAHQSHVIKIIGNVFENPDLIPKKEE